MGSAPSRAAWAARFPLSIAVLSTYFCRRQSFQSGFTVMIVWESLNSLQSPSSPSESPLQDKGSHLFKEPFGFRQMMGIEDHRFRYGDHRVDQQVLIPFIFDP